MRELLKLFTRRKTLKFTQQRVQQKLHFTERAIQSFKCVIYRYIKHHGEKLICMQISAICFSIEQS